MAAFPGRFPSQPGAGGFPPPPGGGFAPPPPPGANFAPPPPGGGFAPPPPGGSFAPPPAGGGFAPPPPPGGNFAAPPPGGNFAPPPPGGNFAPPPPGGNFAPPPPGGNFMKPTPSGPGGFAPPGGTMQQLNSGMANMSMQPPQPGNSGMQQPSVRPSPAMFTPAGPAPGAQPPMLGPSSFHAPPPPGANAPSMPNAFHPVGPPGGQGGSPARQMMPMSTGPPPPGAGMNPPPNNAQFAPASPPGPGGANAAPIMSNENIDYSITIPDQLIRWATCKLPQTTNHANIMKIPMGAVIRPLAPMGPDEESAVETVQPGTAGIIRCKRCRTYMNPFVTWLEHGRRWRCNICGQMNDTPSAYFCHLDDQGLRRDRYERPELCKGVVEFIAPPEYMVRPPQEPAYFFVIDVTASAVRSGMVAAVARSIKASLENLPGRGRTKIGFITFDNGVHYYNLSSGLSSPQMLVVSDLKELFVPLPDDLLVNLQESRSVVETFLDNLPDMFAKRPVAGQSCLGPALKAAFTVVKQIGGKMCVFQSVIPNLGDGALHPREKPGIMGTPNEIKLLKPESTWYKDTAIEFSRQQISVDLFLFPYQYVDFAALGELPRYTSGSLFSYPFFNLRRDGPKFESQLHKVLTQTTAFEAVMRIRCTKGMRITNFYGNFFIRGTDLLALPNCNTDSVFAFDLAHEEQSLTNSHVTIQAALLYTSSDGERRIRVMTEALPVTALLSDVMKSIDCDATCALLAKQALDVAGKSSLDNARMRLQQICVEAIRASKSGDKRTVSGYSAPPAQGHPVGDDDASKPIPENLSLLPLYTLAMMKNVAFRGGTDVHPDERVQAHYTLSNLWVEDSKHFIYPRMFEIHDMDRSAGYPSEGTSNGSNIENVAGRNRIVLPSPVNLSVERLSSDGIFLLDNGVDMYLWVGRSANLNIVGSLFSVHSLEDIDTSSLQVNTSGDEFSSRFGAIVQALREDLSDPFVINPRIIVVKEGDPHMESRFFWFMIEDRAAFQGGTYSYDEYMNFVQNPNASAGGPRQPGPAVGPVGVPRGPPGPPGPVQNQGMQPPQRGVMPPPQQHQNYTPPVQNQPGYGAQPPGPGMPPQLGSSVPPRGPVMQPPPPGTGMQPPSYQSQPVAAAGPPQGNYGHQQPHQPPIASRMPPPAAPGAGGYSAPPAPAQGGSRGTLPAPPQHQQQQAPPGYGAPPAQKPAGMPPPPGRPGPPPPGPPPPGPPPPGPPPQRGVVPAAAPRMGMPPPPPPR